MVSPSLHYERPQQIGVFVGVDPIAIPLHEGETGLKTKPFEIGRQIHRFDFDIPVIGSHTFSDFLQENGVLRRYHRDINYFELADSDRATKVIFKS